VNRVIDFALRQRVLVIAMMLLVFAAGVVCFLSLNIEAYPDPVPPMASRPKRSSAT